MYKPSFATVIGRGPHPRYIPEFKASQHWNQRWQVFSGPIFQGEWKWTCLAILCDLFGMVKTWPFRKVKWPTTRGSKGHFESPGGEFLLVMGSIPASSSRDLDWFPKWRSRFQPWKDQLWVRGHFEEPGWWWFVKNSRFFQIWVYIYIYWYVIVLPETNSKSPWKLMVWKTIQLPCRFWPIFRGFGC